VDLFDNEVGSDLNELADAVVEVFGPELYASPSESMLTETVDHEIDVHYEDGDILDGADQRGLPKGFLLPLPAVYARLRVRTVYVFHGSHVYDNAKQKLDRFLQFKHHYRQEMIAAFESD
jgi:hypothetical protein